MYRAFLWNGTTMQDLGTLGGTYSVGSGINSGGQVAGHAFTIGDAAQHAFLWNGTIMVDLNDFVGGGTGWDLREATGINDSGQLAGWGDLNGEERGFLLTPVPEPGTWAMAGLGLLAAAWRVRARRASLTPSGSA